MKKLSIESNYSEGNIEKLNYIITLLKGRLEKFKDVPYKHIIFGGDFGGEIAIQLMDEVYGVDGYLIYALLLPCYSEQMKENILELTRRRSNIILLNQNRECLPSIVNGVVTEGICSDVINVLRENDRYPSLEVCGCFYPHGSLDNFIEWHLRGNNGHKVESEFTGYYSKKETNSMQRYYLYLFAGLLEDDCNFLYFSTHPEKNFSEEKVHVCSANGFTERGGSELKSLRGT